MAPPPERGRETGTERERERAGIPILQSRGYGLVEIIGICGRHDRPARGSSFLGRRDTVVCGGS